MIVDSSAIVAIFFQEPDSQILLNKLKRAKVLGIGSPTLVECSLVLASRLEQDARGRLARFQSEVGLATIPFTHQHYGVAVDAWLKYGKGRHPAKLNFGDCLTYAVAKIADQPLLFKGDDFSKTDLKLA